jgi:hypothetical protein
MGKHASMNPPGKLNRGGKYCTLFWIFPSYDLPYWCHCVVTTATTEADEKGLKLWVVDLRWWRRGGDDLGCRRGRKVKWGEKIWDGEERSRREGRDGGGGNFFISVEGIDRLPIYPFIMVVTEVGCIGKGEAKRTFNIYFARVSEISNTWFARRFVLGASQHYILAAKDVPPIKIVLHQIFLY